MKGLCGSQHFLRSAQLDKLSIPAADAGSQLQNGSSTSMDLSPSSSYFIAFSHTDFSNWKEAALLTMLQSPADTSPLTHRPLAAVSGEKEECKRLSHSAAYADDVPCGTLGQLPLEDYMDVCSFVSKLGRLGSLPR